MNNLYKIRLFVLLMMISVTFVGCDFSDSKKPRKVSTESEENQNSTGDSGDNTEVIVDNSNSNQSSADNSNKTSGSGQTNVEFSKGSTSKSYKNSVGAGNSQTYVLKVSAGQSLTTKITSPGNGAYFRVLDPSGAYLSSDDGTGFLEIVDESLNKSGNYKIVVKSKKGDVSYNISFSITGGSTTTTSSGGSGGDFTKTVKFAKGKSSASYSADFNAVGPDNQKYILGASSGQTMTVSLNNSDVAFTIVSPGGRTLANQTTSYSGTLSESGNYTVTIDPNTAKLATYRINFAIR